jgi:transcriptional regulator with XRE-family HTH domain
VTLREVIYRSFSQQKIEAYTVGTLDNAGERLRRFRQERGLSQKDLADSINTSTRNIHNWENNKNKPHPHYRGSLARTFGVPINEIYPPQDEERRPVKKKRTPKFSYNEISGISKIAEFKEIQKPEKPEYRTLQHLPFIGRDDDIQKILNRLQKEQFIAITGTIGVGKSELAYQVVKEAKRTRLFADKAARIISLANETSTEGAVKGIKDAIEDIDKEFQRLNLLNTRILLVLDTCEHLKGLKEELYKLIKEHPQQLTILATSSVAMTLSDHRIKSLKTNEAKQLFLEAAKKIGKNSPSSEMDDQKVEELCIHLLDGLPLALLLAAGLLIYDPFNKVYQWAKENSLLDAKNLFSEDERHKTTLRVLFERHDQLLGEDKQDGQQLQALFRRLAIFVAPCSVKAVQAVCIIKNDLPEQEQQLRNLLRNLANHYLITYENDTYENEWIAIRHNILRIFAMLKLKENKEEASEVLRKFIDYYESLVVVYIDKQSNNEELEITEFLKSSHERLENILHTYKLKSSSIFSFIESGVKYILGQEKYELVHDQLINYISENNTTDFSQAPDEIIKKYTMWYKAVEKVCGQEQDLITLNPSLALWQDFRIKVRKSDMFNLIELYKAYGLYK